MRALRLLGLVVLAAATGCGGQAPAPHTADFDLRPLPADWLTGGVRAVSYSGYREGQHPDRGRGASNPSEAMVREDLEILVRDGFRLIRMYDSRDHTRMTLELIRSHGFPIKVLLGAWLDAELSNHEGCPWLEEPIPPAKLAANAQENAREVRRAVELARQFEDVVVAVNVGNEALSEWTDHLVSLDGLVAYVREVRTAVRQPVTVAESYPWWKQHGSRLAAEVDFIGAHTYPIFEQQTIDTALEFMAKGIDATRTALPDRPLVVLEAGWPTTASEFPGQASEVHQRRHYEELLQWAADTATTVFVFEAFDEPWKGDPNDPFTAEKYFGLYDVSRRPKAAMR